ncbi:regulator of chromosome condensation 1/beta-lactamase-inhibitor protein II [Podospora didyma]|uniref:Regulator of chromosome condensation 1/beta-lactamase-inhibitor protein II n=1 Tax=Podospora didyma TaxID=330526 RepID=A0AAE0NNX7_9PEZI|nr:regulator of chromosome condensation 1/beta-lactamase-inhibitor protein II [Podospora didyma]
MSSPFISRLALQAQRPSRIPSQWVRYSSSSNRQSRHSTAWLIGSFVAASASGAGVALVYPRLFNKPAEAALPKKAEIVFEEPRAQRASKEETRNLLSSQHLQVKKSLENPGVYFWGSNAGKVAAPDSDEAVVKTPRRLSYFDGQLLRDLKLDRDFGAAINEKGDLVQWGIGYSRASKVPTITLKGKDLVKLAVSRDRILALSSGGSLYSLPVASSDQKLSNSHSAISSSWFPFWSTSSSGAYRTLKPRNLAWGEHVVDVKSGLEHCLLLTSKGRVFSAASSTVEFPSKGQLGIPGLTWQTRPEGPYFQLHEVDSLRNHKIKSIATGDFHSLALDNEGHVFSFGDNSSGQLGFPLDTSTPYIDKPSELPVKKLYSGTKLVPKVTSIAAGGLNSYFTVDATKTQGRAGNGELIPAVRDVGKTVADTWACGEGIKGSLGNGKWTHFSDEPTKIKALSNLYEYNEATKSLSPIRLARLSVGNTHACAVMDNATHLSTSKRTSEYDTNSGADSLWWGFNEYYQLGTGKRSNINTPTYIGPLDGGNAAVGGGRGETQRLQLAPRTTVRLGDSRRKVSVEQRVECGRHVTAVYSGA